MGIAHARGDDFHAHVGGAQQQGALRHSQLGDVAPGRGVVQALEACLELLRAEAEVLCERLYRAGVRVGTVERVARPFDRIELIGGELCPASCGEWVPASCSRWVEGVFGSRAARRLHDGVKCLERRPLHCEGAEPAGTVGFDESLHGGNGVHGQEAVGAVWLECLVERVRIVRGVFLAGCFEKCWVQAELRSTKALSLMPFLLAAHAPLIGHEDGGKKRRLPLSLHLKERAAFVHRPEPKDLLVA